jgi:hypothetical protein
VAAHLSQNYDFEPNLRAIRRCDRRRLCSPTIDAGNNALAGVATDQHSLSRFAGTVNFVRDFPHRHELRRGLLEVRKS